MRLNNIINRIIAVFAGAAMLVSCNLDLEPSTAIVYDEEQPLFQSEDDIQSFYLGVLASYRSLCSGTFDMTTDVMVDYFNATTGFGNNYGPVHRADNSFTPSDDYVESIWASLYSAIKNYNIAITGAENVEIPELEESALFLKGVASYCRASAYLTLTRLFGEVYDYDTADDALSVPLVLKYSQDYVPFRSTVSDVYSQIEDDLNTAEEILAGTAGEVGAMSPTIDAVRALKARFYLDVQEYDDALKMARMVIESDAGYALASTRDEMISEYTEDAGTEPIMQMYASKTEGTISKSIYTLVGNDDVMGKYFSPYYLPSQTLLDAYEPTDLRRSVWFSTTKYPIFLSGDYYEEIYVFVKYLGNPYLLTGYVETGAHYAKPLMISEMYLIAAEAAYMKEGRANYNSKKYLNDLQAARNTALTDGTLEEIKKEWYKEMVGNGHRFMCLKRWGDGIPARPAQDQAKNLVMTGGAYCERTVDAESHIFNLPIPAYEIQITPSLEQNWGYSAK